MPMAKKEKPIKDQFAAAKARVEKLEKRPSNDQLLAFYGLYKQATEGDATGSRPGVLDFKGRAKYDSWAARTGLGQDAAMKAYVEAVAGLEAENG
jgi:acyl-CoA-binding protein